MYNVIVYKQLAGMKSGRFKAYVRQRRLYLGIPCYIYIFRWTQIACFPVQHEFERVSRGLRHLV